MNIIVCVLCKGVRYPVHKCTRIHVNHTFRRKRQSVDTSLKYVTHENNIHSTHTLLCIIQSFTPRPPSIEQNWIYLQNIDLTHWNHLLKNSFTLARPFSSVCACDCVPLITFVGSGWERTLNEPLWAWRCVLRARQRHVEFYTGQSGAAHKRGGGAAQARGQALRSRATRTRSSTGATAWRTIWTRCSRSIRYSRRVDGVLAKRDDLEKCFGTSDKEAVCKFILKKGQLQVSEKERQVANDAFRDVAAIVRKCINAELDGLSD